MSSSSSPSDPPPPSDPRSSSSSIKSSSIKKSNMLSPNVFLSDHETGKHHRFPTLLTEKVTEKVLLLLNDTRFFQDDYHSVAVGVTPNGDYIFDEKSYLKCKTPITNYLGEHEPFLNASADGEIRLHGRGPNLTAYFEIEEGWWCPVGCILAREYPSPGRRMCYNTDCLSPRHVYSASWSVYRSRMDCPGGVGCKCPRPLCLVPGPTFVKKNIVTPTTSQQDNFS
jgi:hypothetical protein